MSASSSLPLGDFYQGRILNVAHRGARMEAPENTLPAFVRAAELGADGVELDAQISADGVPVVIHDLTVNKTTDGSGRVSEMSLAALRELDAGSHFSPDFAATRIPTLDEVFETLGDRLLINVELKSFNVLQRSAETRLARAVLDVIAAHNMTGRVLISSFNPIILGTVKRLAPALPVGYLHAPRLPLPLARAWLARPLIGPHEARHPHFSMVDAAFLERAHRRGYRVNVWTVNEIEDIQRMRDLGIDMIMSDYPDRVHSVLHNPA